MLKASPARAMTKDTEFLGFFRMRGLIVLLLLMGPLLRAGSIVDLRQGSLGELAAKALLFTQILCGALLHRGASCQLWNRHST